jgi:5-methylcytosine-specific restriction endonuclease McrA
MRYKGIEGRLWKKVSEYVRQRDFKRNNGKCATCNTIVDHWRDLDAGHFCPAGECGWKLRFDPENIAGQCKKCNRFAGGRQAEFVFYLDKIHKTGYAKKLWNQKYKVAKKPSDAEIEKMIKKLINLTKAL